MNNSSPKNMESNHNDGPRGEVRLKSESESTPKHSTNRDNNNDPNSQKPDLENGDGARGGRGAFRRGFGNRGGHGDFRTGFGNRGGRGDFRRGSGNRGGRGDFRRGFGNRGGRGDFRRGFGNRGGRGDFRRGFGNRGGRGDFGDRGGRRGTGDRGGRGDFEDRGRGRGIGDRGGRRGFRDRGGRGDFGDRGRGRGFGNYRGRGDFENGFKNRRFDSDEDKSYENYDYDEWNCGVTEVLDENTRTYFNRVLERLQTGESFENEEDEAIFVTNVLAQTEGKEVLLSCNKLGSKCLEYLLQLPNTKPESILKLAAKFSKDLIFVCTHHFASHVVQSSLKASFLILQNHYTENDSDSDDTSISEIISWLTSVGQVCLENLNDFLNNLYASHIVSTVLQIFGGQTIDENITRSKRSREYNLKRTFSETGEEMTGGSPSKPKVPVISDVVSQIPEECSELLKKIGKEIRQLDLYELSMSKVASPVLQVLLLVTRKIRPKMCQKIIKAILKQVVAFSEEGKLSSFLTNDVASHTMEQVVSVADEKKKQFLWQNFLQGHLKEIALDGNANFVLQHFHRRVEDNEQLEAILNELGPCFEDIFSARYYGVILTLGEACKRLKTGQANFVKSVMSVLHCWDPEDRQTQIVPLILYMVPYEEFVENREKFFQNQVNSFQTVGGINYHGSLILQEIFWFNKPQKFARSLLSLDPVELRSIICDAKGSRVVEAFMQSTFVGDKLRDKLIHILRPELVHLACDKYGSRTVDAMWSVSSLKQKNTIAEELSKKELLMFADRYGQYVAKKTALTHYKHRRKDWEQAMSSSNKKRKLFEDIIGNLNTETQ